MRENENTITRNLWETVKALLSRRFIATQAYLNKQEVSQRNHLTLHLKQLEKEKLNAKASIRKEILKRNKRDHRKINKAEIWFFEKINKIEKSLASIIKKQRENCYIFFLD